MKESIDTLYSTCILCKKQMPQTKKNGQISLCFNCMAMLIQSIDIFPKDDYPTYIDFAYQAKNRLVSGEDIKSISEDAPEGFKKWLAKNAKKTGFAVISDHSD